MKCRSLRNNAFLFLLGIAVAFLLIPTLSYPQDTTTSTTIIDSLIDALTTAKGGGEDTEPKAQSITFTGKLVNYGSGQFLKHEDFTGITNFRYMDGGIGTRFGMAGWSTNADPNKRSVVKVIPFETDTESHIIGATADTSGVTYFKIEGGSFLQANKLWYTAGVTTGTKITYAKVRDTLLIADTGGVTLYSGVSVFPTYLMIELVNGVYADKKDWVYSGVSYAVASGITVHVGYTRKFDRFQADQNLSMDTMTSSVTEYLKSGKMAYWLSYTCKSGGSFFQSPKIECLARELGTSWDGLSWMHAAAAGIQLSGASEFQDYTKFVDNSSEEQPMDLSQMQSGGTGFAGFTYRPRLVHVFLPEAYKNNIAATLTLYYWNGTQWATVPSFSDGTASGGVCLKQSGIWDFEKITNWEKRKVGTIPFDVYAIAWKVSTTISNYVRIYEIKAIPDYDSPSSVGKFRGVASAHDRAFLFNGRDKTKLIISAANQPDCFIGSDSNDEMDKPLNIGKQEDFVWVGPIGEEVLTMKESENWVIGGVNRNTWTKKQLHGTAPCIASDSVAVIETAGGTFAMYLGRDGFYTIPAVEGVNSFDIRGYFETGNALEFPASTLKHAFGWYDPAFMEYHCIINGTELVLSLKHKKWTTFDRTYRLQTGTYFVDKNKVRYHLGGGSGGTVFALESGTSDYGTTIISEYAKPNMILGARAQTKNELRGFGFRYDLPDGSTLSGNTFYITPKATTTATQHSTTFNLLGTEDWKYVNLNVPREAGGLKGWTHKIQATFRGRINLLAQIIWSREAPWEK